VNNVFTEIELRHVFPSSMKDHIWVFLGVAPFILFTPHNIWRIDSKR
jgi:hypothetical protein